MGKEKKPTPEIPDEAINDLMDAGVDISTLSDEALTRLLDQWESDG